MSTVPEAAHEAAFRATVDHEWMNGQCSCGHPLTLDFESARKLWMSHITEIAIEAALSDWDE